MKKIFTLLVLNISFSMNAQGWFWPEESITGDGGYFGRTIASNADGSIAAVAKDLEVKVYDMSSGYPVQLGSAITSTNSSFASRVESMSLDDEGNTLVIGSNTDGGDYRGLAQIYEYDGVSWNVEISFTGEATYDEMGRSVSISGDGTRVALAAPFNDETASLAGHVRVFEKDINGDWNQLGSDIDGDAYADYFGTSISLSDDGNRLIISSPYHNSFSGHAKVFEYSSINGWEQLGSDIEGGFEEYFGISVSINGDGSVIAVGATKDVGSCPDSGTVRVYQYSSGNWQQKGDDLNGFSSCDRFGTDVSLDDNGGRIAVLSNKSHLFTGEPTVYFYDYNSSSDNWVDLGNTYSADEGANTVELSESGSVALVGNSQQYDIVLNQQWNSYMNTIVGELRFHYFSFILNEGSVLSASSLTFGDTTAGSLTVDSVVIDDTTIGHSSDTDLMTLASGSLTVAGDVTISSDARLKSNIVALGPTLVRLLQLEAKSYTMKADKDQKRKIGLLAQEVQKVFPELVTEDKKGMLAVNYQALVPVLINALKEQEENYNELEESLEILENKFLDK